MATPLIMRAELEASKLKVVPSIVTAGEPGEIVCVPTTIGTTGLVRVGVLVFTCPFGVAGSAGDGLELCEGCGGSCWFGEVGAGVGAVSGDRDGFCEGGSFAGGVATGSGDVFGSGMLVGDGSGLLDGVGSCVGEGEGLGFSGGCVGDATGELGVFAGCADGPVVGSATGGSKADKPFPAVSVYGGSKKASIP